MEENRGEKIWHSPDEQPEFYPEQVRSVGKSAVLIDPHSKHYVPTEKAQEELKKKLKNFNRWAYLHNLVQGR